MRGIHAMIDAHRQRMQSVKQKLGYMPENQPPKRAPRKAPSPFEGPKPRAVIPAISARKVIRKSTASCRLSVSARHVGDDAIMIREQESYQEYRIFVCLENNPLTERIDTQALRVTYEDKRIDKDRHHYPDLIVRLRDDRKIAVLVKPWKLSQDKEFLTKVAMMRADLMPEVFDNILVRTERHVTEVQFRNALLIRNYRRSQDPDADQQIAAFAATLADEISVQSLINWTGLGERAFPAVVRAIGTGLFSVRRGTLIEPDGWVIPVGMARGDI
ncbi:hypothetical protein C8J30_1138 [Rhodobacter viridis]|uniref:TnsA endonuclease-like protein n=2 Tax=Rhodobacter viridis TaxID=1054202 RepID=A0A318TTH0_9RHOB|nr:hypothetical protein C8J30_1138 [Rhodobacter viridis]